MANADPVALIKICRFCLCEDAELMIPITDLLTLFNLTIEDVERSSGVEIENKATCTTCMECADKLKASVTFRQMCLEKNLFFRDMYPLLVGNWVEPVSYKIVDRIELSDSDDDMDTSPVAIHADDSGSTKLPEMTSTSLKNTEAPKQNAMAFPVPEPATKAMHSQASEEFLIDDKLFAYSANYISPGEILYDEEENVPMFRPWGNKLNPPAPAYKLFPYFGGCAYRKHYLCAECGLMVRNLKKHNEFHVATTLEPVHPAPEISNDEEDTQQSQAFWSVFDIQEFVCSDELFDYSANFIAPGEILFDPEEEDFFSHDWKGSLNPPPPPAVAYEYVKAKRRKFLCDICGIMVYFMAAHLDTHYEPTIKCPYCTVKMKLKYSIKEHIKQVHLKLPAKTCNICERQFIHHKTYKYHMLTHQSAGKTFECVDCEKTFPNAIYLRDHFNRLHNLARPDRNSIVQLPEK